jgi:hypothetical protein
MMSGSASHTRNRSPRAVDFTGRWRALVVMITPALWLAGAGCNDPLSFFEDAGKNPVVVDAGVDLPPPPPDVGQPDVPGIVDAPVDNVADVPLDVPPDIGVDNGPDVPPDVQPDRAPDVAPDVVPDVRPDVVSPPDVPPDLGVVNNPVVCANDTQCHSPTLALHCLLPGGSCVECTGDAQCGARRCDTNTGSQTFHRCVECMSASDCPTSDDSHPSTCNAEHQCLNGCDDSSGLSCPKAGFTCQSSGGGVSQCVDCLASTECAAPLRVCLHNVCVQCTVNADCTAAGATVCDQVSGRCVQCADSTDCRAADLRLCNPTTHLCVASN